MGTFSVIMEIGGPEGQRFEQVEALVDTGATTTVIPAPLLERLGVSPGRREPFEFADGRQAELNMAEMKVRVGGKETTTWVVFGEDGAPVLLGAYTLEGLLLSVDPYNRRLVPTRGLLMGAG